MEYYDAHCHLQDERLVPFLDDVIAGYEKHPIGKVVVNGTREADWASVATLARRSPLVKPSFGLHPWFVKNRSENWKEALVSFLENPEAGIGEIGLDRWIQDYDLEVQEEVFLWQLRLATEDDRPVSVHCLKAWGNLEGLLKKESLPKRGFLLHSYGGPLEMIESFVKLGAYFSISGYFAHDRKGKAREVFRRIPIDRLLIETDAPDMLGPDRCVYEKIHDESGQAISHPLNITKIYSFVADLVGRTDEELSQIVAENFKRFFA